MRVESGRVGLGRSPCTSPTCSRPGCRNDRRVDVSGHRVTTPGRDFRERSARAVADPELQHALRNLDRRLRTAEEIAAAHPEWKERAAAIRRETLADLDGWLLRLERALADRGMHVHRAETADDARCIVLDIARAH